MSDTTPAFEGRPKDNLVRAARKVLGWTRVDMAARSGLTLEVLNDVERRRPVSQETAEAVAGDLAEGLRSRYVIKIGRVLDVSFFFDQTKNERRLVAKFERSGRKKRVAAVEKALGSPARKS